MSKEIELLKKLKALYDSAEGGEKDNAGRKMRAIMAKHGITAEMIESENRGLVPFRIAKAWRRLFRQVAVSVIDCDFYTSKDPDYRGIYIAGEITNAEAIEIRAKFDFYQEKYKAAENDFFLAFVLKNELTPRGPGRDLSEMTEEEKQRYRRAQDMSRGIDRAEFHKQLTEGKR